MNPSASGWISKFLTQFGPDELVFDGPGHDRLYDHLRSSGFIYGVSVRPMLESPVSTLKLTQLELAKVNLFHALIWTLASERDVDQRELDLQQIIDFYHAIDRGRTGWLQRLSMARKPQSKLENILSARLQEHNNLASNRSTSLLTYALLYVDVLRFASYLDDPEQESIYAGQLENALISVALQALHAKKDKNKYDLQLLELVRDSLEHAHGSEAIGKYLELEAMPYLKQASYREKKYVLDIALLAVWEDRKMEEGEYAFLLELTQIMELDPSELDGSIEHLVHFSEAHASKISLFDHTHPVRQFYNQSTSTVRLLILRNRKRLAKELSESGELMVLLGQSTVRELNREEKRQVRTQLLDMCKSIPSLAIFLLPGGTVLLPLFMKLIPQLLPSSFDENRIADKE
ncbi:LETM1-related biofilm-associated protein [Aureitalea marina]|uniref:Letm1 RBD domain-containing protein n=1 Tax=Aureitalea marina TaxID=930804 RepID=A0A2S7KPU3_9FLAO|nr:LETM1-related biofilm-associated protein [Aureitalea marina]PQB04630.1 hypothetical protein BST85_06770 [Aureitalea marina]